MCQFADSGIFLPPQAGMVFDGGRVHPHRVRRLVHELRQPVDGEARPVLRLALLTDGVRPLVTREEGKLGASWVKRSTMRNSKLLEEKSRRTQAVLNRGCHPFSPPT
jgi:hypothetical protein